MALPVSDHEPFAGVTLADVALVELDCSIVCRSNMRRSTSTCNEDVLDDALVADATLPSLSPSASLPAPDVLDVVALEMPLTPLW